ncbi:MAG: metallophosphoesterase [Moheibacter sp.]
MNRWVFFFIFIFIAEFYTWQAVRTSFENKWVSRIYLLVSVLVIIFLVMSVLSFNQRAGLNRFSMFVISIFLLVYVPKMLIAFFMLVEDVFRLFGGTFRFFDGANADGSFLPERRRFISNAALAIAAIPFASIIYGIWKGKYNYKVLKTTVYYDDLPDEFDGFKILQLSDIHCGSFDNHEKIKYGIDLINQQEYDMMVFTGDMVNSRADEADEWIDLFSTIRKPEFGKFAILGNHDYGDYLKWDSEEARLENQKGVRKIFPKIGFDLLRNENRVIQKGNSKIRLIGVENWGKGHFQKYGDLKKASQNVDQNEFKVLLTHDPSHWDLRVQDNPFHYQLTMAGHTHGSQFGIEIPGFKWSPIKYRYPHWAGLYENSNRYLYVNRGFGYLAFPGRVGIWPEITLIELKKKV